MRRNAGAVLAAVLLVTPLSSLAAPKTDVVKLEREALDLAMRTMAMRSVRGPGNQTDQVARAYKEALVGAGWSDADVAITPLDDTVYLIATWQGSDPKLKPLVLSGHMDVVEARPSDWVRDPFRPVVEGGYLFGRGASDMKLDNAMGLTALIELRRSGYRPRRTIIAAYSGDEETGMATSQVIAERLTGAEQVIDLDFDLNGVLDKPGGKPVLYTWQGAEKSYADFELTVTNPGGHSSEPRADNAITELSRALARIGAYRFPAEASPLTRAYFSGAAKLEANPKIATAMAAFAANPADQGAIEVLRGDVDTNARIATTCVTTMINGGHAPNALPQKVSATVNCRIFPGRSRVEVLEELRKVANEPTLAIRDITEGAVDSPASALRPDFSRAVANALKLTRPGVPIVPGMAKGASDCMWYRAKGVDCYVVSALFMHGDDYRSHGLDERAPIAGIKPAIGFYLSLFRELSQ